MYKTAVWRRVFAFGSNLVDKPLSVTFRVWRRTARMNAVLLLLLVVVVVEELVEVVVVVVPVVMMLPLLTVVLLSSWHVVSFVLLQVLPVCFPVFVSIGDNMWQ